MYYFLRVLHNLFVHKGMMCNKIAGNMQLHLVGDIYEIIVIKVAGNILDNPEIASVLEQCLIICHTNIEYSTNTEYY